MKNIAAYIFLLIISTFILVSCSDSPNDTSGNGRIKLYMVDAPGSMDSVIIDIQRVEVHSEADGWLVVNDVPAYYDLLLLTNGTSVVLGDEFLAPGLYTQIRLILGPDNYVYDNGVKYELVVPSGMQTGLKLVHQFEIEPNNLYELYLDFNVDKSIHVTGSGKYMLKPTVRLQPAIISGTISGQVLPIEANAVVWTTAGPDTISTYPDTSGFFKLMCLPEGIYQVRIEPGDTNYVSQTVPDVPVTAMQNTNIGVITLSTK
jgi:hypothetical protein